MKIYFKLERMYRNYLKKYIFDNMSIYLLIIKTEKFFICDLLKFKIYIKNIDMFTLVRPDPHTMFLLKKFGYSYDSERVNI